MYCAIDFNVIIGSQSECDKKVEVWRLSFWLIVIYGLIMLCK